MGTVDPVAETIYELWDTPSRNLIATYRSEPEALAAVRTFIADDGEESIVGVALLRRTSDDGNVVAADADLARLARGQHRGLAPTGRR